jgi:UDP-N-acetylmuramoylalanine--D-glutamate ligase
MDLSNKKSFFVLGMGKSGVAVAQLLVHRGFSVVVHDDDVSRMEPLRRDASLDFATGDDAAEKLSRSDCLVLSPGVPLDHALAVQAQKAGIEIAGELEIAYHFCDARIVGVTGTNGKSTVVSLLGRILEKARVESVVAGNIGTPLSSIVDSDSVPGTIVLEISSFQLDTIHDFRVDVAVLLNVTADHLDRYDDSFDNYVDSKARILNRSNKTTVLVYNDDDSACRRIATAFGGKKIAFSSARALEQGVYLRDNVIVRDSGDGPQVVIAVADFPPVGIHNLENAMAAIAAAVPLDVDGASVHDALATYEPLPHRMEPVRVVCGVAYINDSKATNVDAAIKSIRSIDGPLILIMGGLDKNGDFTLMTDCLGSVKEIVLIGRAADKIAAALTGHATTRRAATMSDAISLAAASAEDGDTVLLAPACASFDMFDNYGARGEAFRDAVVALEERVQ